MIKNTINLCIALLICAIHSFSYSQTFSDEINLLAPISIDRRAVEMQDITGDNLKDMILAGDNEFPVSYKINLGNGLFSQNINIPMPRQQIYMLLVRDFNGDGFKDILTLNSNSYSPYPPDPFFPVDPIELWLSIYFNDGNGNYNSSVDLLQYNGFLNIQELLALDQNNDGKTDFIFNEKLFTNIDGYSFSETNLPGHIEWYNKNRIYDMNHDGYMDLIRDMGAIQKLFWGSMNGFTDDSLNFDFSSIGVKAAYGDVSGDELEDLLILDSSVDSIYSYINQGGFQFNLQYESTFPFQLNNNVPLFELADLNGDSLNDLVFFEASRSTLSYSLRNETGWSEIEDINLNDLYIGQMKPHVIIEDIDLDGEIDLLFRIDGLYYTSGIFLKRSVLDSNSNWIPIEFPFYVSGMGKFNEDNLLDISITAGFARNYPLGALYKHYLLNGRLENDALNTLIATNFQPNSFNSISLLMNADEYTDFLKLQLSEDSLKSIVITPYINSGFNQFQATAPVVLQLLSPLVQNPAENLYIKSQILISEADTNYILSHISSSLNNENERVILIRHIPSSGFEIIVDWSLDIPNYSWFSTPDNHSKVFMDMDGDNDFDFIYRDQNNQNIYIIKNLSSVSYESVSEPNLIVNETGYSNLSNLCSLGDFNNDGYNDIVSLKINELQNININWGVESFEFSSPQSVYQDSCLNNTIKLIDINNDNFLDIIVRLGICVNNIGKFVVLENNEGTGFIPQVIDENYSTYAASLDFFGYSEPLFVVDFNNDFSLDLINGTDRKISLYLNTDFTVGTSNKMDINSIIYPNPSSDVIYFKSKNSCFDGFSYEIVNVYGQTKLAGKVLNSSVSVSDLMPGLYFIRLFTSSSNLNFSFLKN